MIIGFHYTGEPMEFLFDLAINKDFIKTLLGVSPPLENCEKVYISYLMDHFFGQLRQFHVFILEQRAWTTILIILASTLSTNGRELIKLDVLASLQLINKVKDYA